MLEPEAEQDVECIFNSILVESYKAICPVEVVHDVDVKTNGLGYLGAVSHVGKNGSIRVCNEGVQTRVHIIMEP